MHEIIPSNDDVLAVKVAHKITGEDLDSILDRLDALLARDGPIHVFVETEAIDGIELASLPGYTARAMPLFGQLRRFGRVAVVADQGWVRVGARLESAVLPFINYKTFEPDERALALAWVEGKTEAPAG